MIYEQCVGFLKTPPLWNNEQFGIQQFKFPSIELNNFEATPISYKRRLGHQMEAVFKQLVNHIASYEILVHNLPIRDGKKTLGEIDFILKPARRMGREIETAQLVHVELTYKFYIIDTNISEPIHRLIGPNRKDTFFTKMEKIKHQQFPLLHSFEGAKALWKNGIDFKKIEHQCCFKAQLFVPFGKSSIEISPLNKECIQGFWLKLDDFKGKEFKEYAYYIPNKSEWVIAPHIDFTWKTHFEILKNLNLQMLNKNAPMVWLRKSATQFEKFFVVWW